MCGIAGFLDALPERRREESEAIALAMTDALRHRGPDDGGIWVQPEAGIALGNRRLAIVDLSGEGHQPMESDGSVIAFNGEIYNFEELRVDLLKAGVRFRGRSDTEVALASIDSWGLERALQRFNGMFAFALWNRAERTLTLCRDRLGEKPLYWGTVGGTLVFGSELKSLKEFPGFNTEIDREALASFMRHKYIPAPHSIYAGVHKLPPASFLTWKDGALRGNQPYWDVCEVAEESAGSQIQDEQQATEELQALLDEAIALRMVADVPLGAFLSGGIDSSAVVASMQAQSAAPVKTFTIGFSEATYDESKVAAAVARHLGTDHTELIATPEDALAVIPLLPTIYDEPFADSSQIPTFLVAQLARQHVTVSLSGDGGDEVFGGYNRYLWGPRVWDRARRIPHSLRRGAGATIGAVPPSIWDSLLRPTGQRMAGDKMHKLAGALSATDERDLYRRLVSHWQNPTSIVVGANQERRAAASSWSARSLAEQMMLWDTEGYLPDDILVKLDRATMAVSLEGRVPLLDHRLVAFAWRLPASFKVRDGQSKWLLRKLLAGSVPPALTDRPKMGFGVPIHDWLRGPLRGWAEDLLHPSRLRTEGFLHPGPITAVWREHLSGRRNHQYRLWDVLMFQAWLEAQP